jgi:CBS domain containing-hemolysin-like protein
VTVGVVVFLSVSGLIALIAFGGFMAASEAAMGVLSTDDLLQLSQARRSGRSVAAIAREPGPHRTVTTFVRIVSETSAAVLVTFSLLLSGLADWAALVIAVFVMAAASFVLAGSSPRSFGRAHPNSVMALSAPIVHFLRVVLGPLATALVAFGDRVTPGRPATSSFTNEEQLLSMVDEAVRHDVLESEEQELIHSIFEWGDTVAREVMVPRIDMVTLPAETLLKDALPVFYQSGHSRIPVIGDDVDDVVGVVNLKDVSRRSFEKPAHLSSVHIRELARPASFIPESKKADDTLRQLQSEATHMAIVVDEYGGIAGLLTLEDLLEELVGDIADEHDRGIADVQEVGHLKFIVSTRLPVDELGELFGLDLEDDDVDSVGGLLAKELERLPRVGDRVELSGLILEADKSDARRRRVTRVIVERAQALKEAEAAFASETGE